MRHRAENRSSLDGCSSFDLRLFMIFFKPNIKFKQTEMLYSVNLLPIERLSLLRIGIEKDYSAEPPGVPSSLLLSGEINERDRPVIHPWHSSPPLPTMQLHLWVVTESKLHNLTTCWAVFLFLLTYLNRSPITLAMSPKCLSKLCIYSCLTESLEDFTMSPDSPLDVQSVWERLSDFKVAMNKWHVINVKYLDRLCHIGLAEMRKQ